MKHAFISYADINAKAPAAFAQNKAVGLSDRYSFISTLAVIDQLADHGWYPVAAQQNLSKRVKDPVHATHMITFRTPYDIDSIEVGDLIPQIMFINDHRGRKSAELPSGFERLACKNGLTVATGIAEGAAVQIHLGDAELNIQQALARAINVLKAAQAEVEAWRQIELNGIEQLAFAGAALRLRYPDSAPVTANPLLLRNRLQDCGNDLWTVFNVIQENLTQGGVTGIFSRRRLRRVSAITPGQTINQGLWRLAGKIADAFTRKRD